MAKNEKPNWDAMETEAVRTIRMLRMAWEHTSKEVPKELHAAMSRDLYIPALERLAAFCACVNEETEPPQ